MRREEVLRTSLVSLGAAVFLVGLCTFSFKKMIATYIFGILAVCGILLPDWEFFDRDFSQWFTPCPPTATPALLALSIRPPGSEDLRSSSPFLFRFYPLRVALLAAVYSFGLYKWWVFMSS
ncbi:unnamed protein product [Spirodela intermedia]|uniref:Uncharacterized protein n=1 Tax=Spirodela intermedia TaxID=51605 RepID=A0A7I8J6K7_SPIIN|nr:unnamed protein product [Spirodela intermedia]CAA6665033.1 unnamed protein product [Spirodela intermedia]